MSKASEQPTNDGADDKNKPGILHIRLDKSLLDESQALAKELGFNLSTHVRVLLRRALDERKRK